MKKLISTSLVLLFFICVVLGQSSNIPTSDNLSEFVSYRSNELGYYLSSPTDIKKLKGYWISLAGDAILKIYESNKEILIGGDYFPGVSRDGDKAILSLKNNEKGYYLNLNYLLSPKTGGGGSGIDIVYYPADEHIVVGKPPYHIIVEGKLYTTGSNTSTAGIYGKEFKRMK